MKQYKLIIIFILCLVGIFVVSAQDPVSLKYTVSDGLKSNEVYDIVQDQRGYLYISTNAGLNKFDGYAFTHINNDIIKDEPIVRMTCDSLNRIWGICMSGKIIIISDSITTEHPMSKRFKRFTHAITYDIVLDKELNLWVKTKTNTNEFFISQDTIIRISRSPITAYKNKDTLNGNVYWIAHFQKIDDDYSVQKGGYLRHDIPKKTDLQATENGFFLRTELEYFSTNISFTDILTLDDETAVCYFGPKVYIINTVENKIVNTIEPQPTHNIIDLHVDTKKRIWVSIYNKGIRLYKDANLKDCDSVFSSYSISNIFQDRESNIWLSTLKRGVIYIENSYIKEFKTSTQDQIIDFAEYKDDLLLLAENKIQKYRFGDLKLKNTVDFPGGHYGNQFWEDGEQVYVTGKRLYLFNDSGLNPFYNEGCCNWVSKRANNDLIIACSNASLSYISGSDQSSRNHLTAFKYKIYDMTLFRDTLWVGTDQGLFYLSPSDSASFHLYDYEQYQVNCLLPFKNQLILGTHGNGLIIKDKVKASKYTHTILSKDVESIEKLIYDTDDSFLLISSNEIYKVSNDDSGYLKATTLVRSNNLTKAPFYKIKRIKDNYWLAASNGTFILDLNYSPSKNTLPAPIFLHKTEVNNKTIDLFSDITLKHNQNNLSFNFSSVQFRNHEQLTYQFKIDHIDGDYNTTDKTSCTYYSLPPGRHTFRVKALNADGVYTNEAFVSFTIRKHWANTWWFRISVLVILLAAAYLIFRSWYKRRKRFFTQEQELMKAELKAFRSQMNPHFIFNAMNAIQNLVLLEKTEQAYEYLSQFSVLMRKTLNYSKKHNISLDKEIQFINSYVHIESLRFKKKFSYNLHLDPDVDPTFILIPPFILQPLIENAIIHGLTPLDKDGELHISISKDGDNYIRIEIKDNGVGRKRSSELNKIRKDHESTGMENIQERINLLNHSSKKIHFEIIDLYTDTDHAAGTLIKLKFPLQ